MTDGVISGMVDALGDTGRSAFLPPQSVARRREIEYKRKTDPGSLLLSVVSIFFTIACNRRPGPDSA
jgi:hypothetical protein